MATTATAVCAVSVAVIAVSFTVVAIIRPELAGKALDTIRECVAGRSGREEKRDRDTEMSTETRRGRAVNH